MMTRSRSLALVLSVPIVGLPLLGCARPSRHGAERAPPEVLLAEVDRRPDAEDRRPDAGTSAVDEDVTEMVRAQNAPGKEPPLPDRQGYSSYISRHPAVTRTAKGFVAHIPGARWVPTPAHHRGKIVVGGFGTWEIHAVNAESGTPAWSLHLSDDGPTDPACQDGVCVFNTYSCTMYGVDADTGKTLWSWYLGSPQLATPVIDGDLVYSSYPHRGTSSGADYAIAAFDLKKGTPKWRRWIDAEVNSTPVTDGQHLWVATKAGTLYQLGARDGAVVAVHKNRVAAPPVMTLAGIVFGRDQSAMRENDLIATSQVLFPSLEVDRRSRPQGVKPQPRPLVARHGLYTIEHGLVVATNRKSGHRMWQLRTDAEMPADVPSPLLYAGKSILLATAQGNVLRLDPDTGEVVDAFPLAHGVFSSQPIAVDGWLYAGTKGGEVVGFNTGHPELTGWEMLGGSPDRRGSADEEGS